MHAKGYGVITPGTEEIVISEPEIIRHGNKFGVKIKAVSPSVHLIQANIETEIAPIVGTQQHGRRPDPLYCRAECGGRRVHLGYEYLWKDRQTAGRRRHDFESEPADRGKPDEITGYLAKGYQ